MYISNLVFKKEKPQEKSKKIQKIQKTKYKNIKLESQKRKMNEIEPAASNEAVIIENDGKPDANVKIIQRNYTLNEVGAIKKKLKHETRKQVFCLKEAKDASNVVVQMKTSFFEFTKSRFVQQLREQKEILDIKNVQSAKAPTETSGDAFVEYSVEIVFKVNMAVYTIFFNIYSLSLINILFLSLQGSS